MSLDTWQMPGKNRQIIIHSLLYWYKFTIPRTALASRAVAWGLLLVLVVASRLCTVVS